MSREDVKGLGLILPTPLPCRLLAGEEYIDISTLKGVSYTFDEKTLSLNITASPNLLPQTILDFSTPRNRAVIYPAESSAFFNYGLDYNASNDSSLNAFTFTHEMGFRRGKALFLTDGSLTDSSANKGYTRLLTRAVIDDRDRLQRLVLGDFYARSGDLGGTVNLGGIGFSREFLLDPYKITYPSIHLQGAISTPSEAEFYLDGNLIRREKLPPGPFEIRNLTRYGGAGNLEIVLKDAFGRETHLTHPFYLDESLLKAGQQEYSYNIGVRRENFGTTDSSYDEFTMLGFHRYGWDDRLTVGLGGELGREFLQLAPELRFLAGAGGAFTASVGGSFGSPDRTGTATSLRYSYRNYRFSTDTFLRTFSEGFTNVSTEEAERKPDLELGLRFGFSTANLGSFAASFTSTSFHDADAEQTFTLNYNRRLFRSCSLFSSIRHFQSGESETSFIVGVNYHPWRTVQASARIQGARDTGTESLQVQKSPPLGKGYGWRAAVEHDRSEVRNSSGVNAFGQYNGTSGIVRGEGTYTQGDGGSNFALRLGLAGSLVWLQPKLALSRPVEDSFALVKVSDLENVPVYWNTHEIGRTDERGEVLVPALSSFYDNQISIDSERIPIEYSLKNIRYFVSPPFRGGACIFFPAERIRPITGRLVLERPGDSAPLEFRKARVRYAGGQTVMQTGSGGEFYLDPSDLSERKELKQDCFSIEKADRKETPREFEISAEVSGTIYRGSITVEPEEGFYFDAGTVRLRSLSSAPKE